MTTHMPRLSAMLYLQLAPWYAEQAVYYGTLCADIIRIDPSLPQATQVKQDLAAVYARWAWSYALDSVNWREEAS